MATKVDAQERRVIEIALGYSEEPKKRREAILLGLATRPTSYMLEINPVVKTVNYNGAAVLTAPAAPLVKRPPLAKRSLGTALPTSAAIMGSIGAEKTTVCRHTKCGKVGHDYYECPIAFFEHFATPMPGFTAEGIIAEPHLYWAKGVPGTQISSKIAALWEQHSWSAEMQTEMSTTINESALRKLTTQF
jgi:hypothetical protein